MNLPTDEEIYTQDWFTQQSLLSMAHKDGNGNIRYWVGYKEGARWIRSIAEQVIKEKGAEIENLKNKPVAVLHKYGSEYEKLLLENKKLKNKLQIAIEALELIDLRPCESEDHRGIAAGYLRKIEEICK